MATVEGAPRLANSGDTLNWSGRVLSYEDVRRSVNGHRHVAVAKQAVVTPLAMEELRAAGIAIERREEAGRLGGSTTGWAVAQERAYPNVALALASLAREGLNLQAMGFRRDEPGCDWTASIASRVSLGETSGCVVLCESPALVCCVANKFAGVRAAAVSTVSQAAEAAHTMAPNVFAIEMPGRTYFEVRQVLRIASSMCAPKAPEALATLLDKLESHAHR